MAADLEAAYLDANLDLVKGGGGVFDVHVDGKLVYSKKKENRGFPESDLVIRRIDQLENELD